MPKPLDYETPEADEADQRLSTSKRLALAILFFILALPLLKNLVAFMMEMMGLTGDQFID